MIVIHKMFRYLILFPLVTTVSCVKNEKAEVVVHNANIYTLTDGHRKVEAMAIDSGRIVAIGAEHEIMNRYLAKEYIDLRKRTVIPGAVYWGRLEDSARFKSLFAQSANPCKEQEFFLHKGYTAALLYLKSWEDYRQFESWAKSDCWKLKVELVLELTPENLKLISKEGANTKGKVQLKSLWVRGENVSRDDLELLELSGFQADIFLSQSDSLSKVFKDLQEVLKGMNDKRWRIHVDRFTSCKEQTDLTLLPIVSKNTSVDTVNKTFRCNHNLVFEGLQNEGLLTDSLLMTRFDSERSEKLNRKRSLRCQSFYPAMAIRREAQIGSLEKGKDADFVVLNGDPLKVPISLLGDLRMKSVYLKGEAFMP